MHLFRMVESNLPSRVKNRHYTAVCRHQTFLSTIGQYLPQLHTLTYSDWHSSHAAKSKQAKTGSYMHTG